jgi:steroid 5-alpha reductase family enzyme
VDPGRRPDERLTVGEEFLITEMQCLFAHIAAVIQANTSRVNNFLLVMSVLAILLAGVLPIIRESVRTFVIFGSSCLLAIGLYTFYSVLEASLAVVRYFRIINLIRGYFWRRDLTVRSIEDRRLPLSAKEPSRILDVFEPGLLVVGFINCFFLGVVIWYALPLTSFPARIVFSVVAITPLVFLQYLLVHRGHLFLRQQDSSGRNLRVRRRKDASKTEGGPEL